jgi:nicotinamidase-related amidase
MSDHKSALILGHIQPPITDLAGDATFIDRLAETVEAARSRGVLIAYVKIGFRPGHIDLPVDHPLRLALGDTPAFVDRVANDIHERVAPKDGDIVVTSARVSGFAGTDLDLVLRANGVDHVVLTGISTGGVVLGTLVDAHERDFKVTVLSDLVSDPNPDIHAALLRLYGEAGPGLPWSSSVTSAGEWLTSLG